MHLTKEEEKILDGEEGEVPERLFRLLVRLGDIYGAEKMIPVGSVQVAGVSYKSVGDPGLAFLEDMASKGAKVKVLTYLNPAGMDLENWEKLGFPKDFAKNQIRVMDAFKKMGIVITSTCTPYLAGNLPRALTVFPPVVTVQCKLAPHQFVPKGVSCRRRVFRRGPLSQVRSPHHQF